MKCPAVLARMPKWPMKHREISRGVTSAQPRLWPSFATSASRGRHRAARKRRQHRRCLHTENQMSWLALWPHHPDDGEYFFCATCATLRAVCVDNLKAMSRERPAMRRAIMATHGRRPKLGR